jgi:hypothetical protein
LISTIRELKKQGCLCTGQEITIEEILDSAEEHQIGESEFMFKGGDNEIVVVQFIKDAWGTSQDKQTCSTTNNN